MSDDKLRERLKSLYDFVKYRYTDELPDLVSDMEYHKVLSSILNRLLAICVEDANENK